MAKKQKSFADKAAGSKDKEAIYVKYVKSVKSEKTGQWRFNEQMVRSKKGEQLDVALKRMDEVANLVDIDLSQFAIADTPEVPVEDAVVESNETVDETVPAVEEEEQPDTQDDNVEDSAASKENSIDEPVAEESPESGTEESEDQSVDSDSNDEAPSENDSSETEEDKPEKKGEDSLEASD